MKEKLNELLSKLPIEIESDVEYVADVLIANGVTILPEGAIILTRAELDALNKHNEKVRLQAIKDAIAEVEEIIRARGRLENMWSRTSNSVEHSHSFLHGMNLCASLLVDLKKLKARYEDETNSV